MLPCSSELTTLLPPPPFVKNRLPQQSKHGRSPLQEAQQRRHKQQILCMLRLHVQPAPAVNLACSFRRLSRGGMGGSGRLRPSEGRVTDQLSEADGMQQLCELTVEFEEVVTAQVGWLSLFLIFFAMCIVADHYYDGHSFGNPQLGAQRRFLVLDF